MNRSRLALSACNGDYIARLSQLIDAHRRSVPASDRISLAVNEPPAYCGRYSGLPDCVQGGDEVGILGVDGAPSAYADQSISELVPKLVHCLM